jgi:hypothetical protein
VLGDGLWIRDALLFEDACGEGVRIVGGKDRAGALQDDAALVVFIGDFVDGAAADGVATGEDCGVDAFAIHAGAAVAGEKGGVDVKDAAAERGRHGHFFEVASEDDVVDVVSRDEREDGICGRVAGEDDGGDVVSAGVGCAGGFFARDDEGDCGGQLGRIGRVIGVLDEVEERAARAGEEDGEAGKRMSGAAAHLVASKAAGTVG